MRRRWLLLVSLIGLAGAALCVAVVRSPQYQKWYRPPVLVLPAADEIAEMRARAFQVEVHFVPAEIPEFVVPPEHVPHILYWLNPTEYAGYSESYYLNYHDRINPVICEVLIRTRQGGEMRLSCRDWGKNPIAFTANGEDYFYGSGVDEEGHYLGGGLGLYKAIRKAHEAAKR